MTGGSRAFLDHASGGGRGARRARGAADAVARVGGGSRKMGPKGRPAPPRGRARRRRTPRSVARGRGAGAAGWGVSGRGAPGEVRARGRARARRSSRGGLPAPGAGPRGVGRRGAWPKGAGGSAVPTGARTAPRAALRFGRWTTSCPDAVSGPRTRHRWGGRRRSLADRPASAPRRRARPRARPASGPSGRPGRSRASGQDDPAAPTKRVGSPPRRVMAAMPPGPRLDPSSGSGCGRGGRMARGRVRSGGSSPGAVCPAHPSPAPPRAWQPIRLSRRTPLRDARRTSGRSRLVRRAASRRSGDARSRRHRGTDGPAGLAARPDPSRGPGDHDPATAPIRGDLAAARSAGRDCRKRSTPDLEIAVPGAAAVEPDGTRARPRADPHAPRRRRGWWPDRPRPRSARPPPRTPTVLGRAPSGSASEP